MTDGQEGYIITAPTALGELVQGTGPGGHRRRPEVDAATSPCWFPQTSTQCRKLIEQFEEVAKQVPQGRTSASSRGAAW